MLEFIDNESTQIAVRMLNELQPCSCLVLGAATKAHDLEYGALINILMRLRRYGLAKYEKSGKLHIYELTDKWSMIINFINQINDVSDKGRINKEV